MHTKFSSGNLNGRDHSEDVGLERRIMLEWILENKCVRVWTGFIYLRLSASGGLY